MNLSLDTIPRVARWRLIPAAVLAVLLLAPGARAQVNGNAPNNNTPALLVRLGTPVTVRWAAPLQFHDGTPLGAAALTYSVYSAVPGAPWKVAASALSGTTWVSPPLTVKAGSCYLITAWVLGLESIPTPSVCVLVGVAPGAPGAPTVS